MSASGSAWLVARSLLWTILLPGLVAGFVPWRFFGLGAVRPDWGRPLDLLGVAAVGVGVLLLGACILEFARSGRGTLAPMDPPKELVVQGLYRFVRNPMYLSVALILVGECLLTRSVPLVWYAAAWFVVVNLFVIGYEEPTLRRTFGASYERYVRRVGRWLPRPPARERGDRV
jgi:protein-S-isoprenylcysteine O-methyltransferase Ste14